MLPTALAKSSPWQATPDEDYERYEGREPEPVAPEPSQGQVLADLLSVLKRAVDDQRYVETAQGMIEWYDDALVAIAQAEAAQKEAE